MKTEGKRIDQWKKMKSIALWEPFPFSLAILTAALGWGPSCTKGGKMVAIKKIKIFNSRLPLDMKSGKYMLGYKQGIKMTRLGKMKLVSLTNNCPALRKSEIEY